MRRESSFPCSISSLFRASSMARATAYARRFTNASTYQHKDTGGPSPAATGRFRFTFSTPVPAESGRDRLGELLLGVGKAVARRGTSRSARNDAAELADCWSVNFSQTTTDTIVAIPSNFVTGDSVTVAAMDANYVAAQQDQAAGKNRGRAGIDRGFGVFAAITRSKTVIP